MLLTVLKHLGCQEGAEGAGGGGGGGGGTWVASQWTPQLDAAPTRLISSATYQDREFFFFA